MRQSTMRAFTLIEMLVVVAIIGILLSVSFAAFSGATGTARKGATKTMIEQIKTALENYSNDFGDYPPSSPRRSKDKGINDGIESLVRCLMTTEKNGPYLQFSDKKLYDSDSDSVYEVIDDWGRPFIYLHNKDYAKGQKVSILDENLVATSVDAKGSKSDKTSQYQSLSSFQIWSCGPDGKNNGGKDDDINSWD